MFLALGHSPSPIHSPSSEIRDLWDDLLPPVPHAKPPGAEDMLHIIAYDITEPKRLARVAEICEDFGARVQYSLFECWLTGDDFERFWSRLLGVIDPKEDRLVAYVLDAAAVRERRKAGDTMVLTERINCHFV